MLRLKRSGASLWAFGAPRRGERCLCRADQMRLSNWQPISAAFSAGSSLSVTQRRQISGPTLQILAPKAGFSCTWQFIALARRYSSQVAGEPESTTFLGEDDADYLQRMVALGSSVSQASDLAPLEAQLAMPNIPMTVKTIGAKVIIAALEQRQQWALLPALLSIPEFRRLAQSHNFGVGEQLFAALLRGQFAFASRRGGAAPDVFRTLDLAAKCNALRTPSVTQAVRAGYQSLGLESPTRITELLDIGPTDSASLQRLKRRRDDSDAEEGEPSDQIGIAMGRLTGGMFMRQIIRARKRQSVYTVLPAVLAALPRVHDRDPNGRQRILGAICGRDIYTISAVLGLARALGTTPNATVWSQVTTNALRMSGATDASEIVLYVYNNVPDGYVAFQSVHHVIATLVGSDHVAIPPREAVQLAWQLFELHRTKGGDRALEVRNDTPGTLMVLIAALMADFNIHKREDAIEVISRYTETKRIFKEGGKFHNTWAGVMAELASLRCTSHLDALEAALAEPGGPVTEYELSGIFGSIMRYRYADATTAPVAALLRIMDFARDKGFALDRHYLSSYIRSIAISVVRLHVENGAGLLPLIPTGQSDQTVPEQHLSQALTSIRQVEKLCHEPDSGFTLDERLVSALFVAYSVHPSASDDCARMRSAVLADPSSASRTGIRLLHDAHTYEELKDIWATLSSPGLQQSIGIRCHYAERLLDLHRVHAAIEYVHQHIPDDPNEPEVVRFVARLLIATENTQFRLTARGALPITVNDARTREAVNKVIAHRRRMGLKQMTTVPDI